MAAIAAPLFGAASAEEGFEIVRYLFQPITGPELFTAGDAVVKALADEYRKFTQELSACRCVQASGRGEQTVDPEFGAKNAPSGSRVLRPEARKWKTHGS